MDFPSRPDTLRAMPHLKSTLAGTALLACSLAAAFAQIEVDLALVSTRHDNTNLWFDIRQLGVEGKGWRDTKAPFDRLPAKAEGKVRGAVWSLSRNSAGMHVRFVTDATTLQARWAVTSSNLAMPHMAATGVSGLDLYGHLRKLVEKFGTAEKEIAGEENDVDDASHETLPVGTGSWIF